MFDKFLLKINTETLELVCNWLGHKPVEFDYADSGASHYTCACGKVSIAVLEDSQP